MRTQQAIKIPAIVLTPSKLKDNIADMSRLHLKISGRVQGVFFRAHTQEKATELGLTGWVKNTYDGAVETIAEGDRQKLEEFLSWCHHGPAHASVTRVEEEWEESTGEFSRFSITY